MIATTLRPTDVAYIDELFNWPAIEPVPASVLANIPQNDLSLWCLKRAIYQVPTTELIDFLSDQIGNPATALEIGAGTGQIGRHLAIRMTDNKMQLWPEIQQHYARLNQPTIQYGKDVERLPAADAIKRYKPTTVVGCWVTQKHKPDIAEGNVYGVDEQYMLRYTSVEKYIVVGNVLTHGDKEILRNIPHQVYWFDWLYSRSMERSQNAIWIFTPKK